MSTEKQKEEQHKFDDFDDALSEIKSRMCTESHQEMQYEITYYPFAEKKEKYRVDLVPKSGGTPANEYFGLWKQYEDPMMDHTDYARVVYHTGADMSETQNNHEACKICMESHHREIDDEGISYIDHKYDDDHDFEGSGKFQSYLEDEVDGWFDDASAKVDEEVESVDEEVEKFQKQINGEDN